jgi:hypothetical protein
MTQGTPETEFNSIEDVSPVDGRVEWERPVLFRLAANEADNNHPGPGNDGTSGSS